MDSEFSQRTGLCVLLILPQNLSLHSAVRTLILIRACENAFKAGAAKSASPLFRTFFSFLFIQSRQPGEYTD
jgi:hypothetical protein